MLNIVICQDKKDSGIMAVFTLWETNVWNCFMVLLLKLMFSKFESVDSLTTLYFLGVILMQI